MRLTFAHSGRWILHEQFCLMGGSDRKSESLVVDNWLLCLVDLPPRYSFSQVLLLGLIGLSV